MKNDIPLFPLISVVIPARNEEVNIGNSVQSVIRQASEGIKLEVIVVDDGSTDGTVDIARSVGARVLELGRQGSGKGCAAARNRGVAIAKGDPLIFLDADCVAGNGWLHAILAAHANGAAVVGGLWISRPGSRQRRAATTIVVGTSSTRGVLPAMFRTNQRRA